MCGIVGYIGNGKASQVLIKGLKNLEYRGYDSCGMAIVSNKKIIVKKDIGKIDEVDKKLKFEEIKGNIGIAHTRWSTHGSVTKNNAHPHTDCSGKIAIVHNGIIENYQELKKNLVKKGHVFKSDTDTEIIAHLIEEYNKELEFKDAVKKTLSDLRGSYAIVIVNSDLNEIIGARNGSPLVLGIGKNKYFLASDIPAFLEYTKNIIYLYDNDVVFLNDKMEIFNLKENREVERKLDTIEWDIEQAKKGEYEHFMLKEISEQTETIKKSIEQDPEVIKEIANKINTAFGVFFVACGSSYHACLSASYIFSKVAKKHINVILASEFKHYEHFVKDKTLVIAVSQSGETADVLEAVNIAKKRRAEIVSIVNVMGSSLTRFSDNFLLLNAGPEICVLSTKTYTSQLALLLLLVYACIDKFELGKEKLEYTQNLIYNLTSRNTRDYIRKLADRIKDKEHIYTIGRGLNYPTAIEAALKIKEVSYIHAEGFAGGELKHGTIALIEKDTPCIVFCGKDDMEESLSNAIEIKSRGGYIIGIAPENNEIFDFFIKVPQVGDLNSIIHIIPIQILAYQLAVLRGCDPDKPRNLAKSVTVK